MVTLGADRLLTLAPRRPPPPPQALRLLLSQSPNSRHVVSRTMVRCIFEERNLGSK